MRAYFSGRKRFGGWRGRRPGISGLVAAGSALALFVSLALVAVTIKSPGRAVVPVQQWGTAAGRPHRVSAATDVGRIVDGRFVSSAPAAGRAVFGPVAAGSGVPGAMPAAAKPTPLKLPARGKGSAEGASVLKPPAAVQKTGFNQKTSRELAPTQASQVVYVNADGTKTAFEYPVPVNYRLPDGGWAAISSTLVPAGTAGAAGSGTALLSPSGSLPAPAAISSPDPPSPAASAAAAGGWTEKSEALPESFATYANAADLVMMPVDGGHRVSFGISGAQPVTGSASGNTVTYPGVRSGSSAVFSAGTGMVKEDIVLSSASAPSVWVFPLDLVGLRARMGPGGVIEFTDASGKVLAYVPHGIMSDSNINPRSGDGATSTGVTYSLVMAGGRQAIKMTLDAAWLDSKDRVYPVRVDPSVSDARADGTTYVQYPESGDFSGGVEIHVGTWDGGSDKAESYLAFGSVASSLKNDTVLGARLGVFNTWSYSCSPRPVYVYPVTSAWSVTGSKSWPGPSTGAAIGRASFATGWVPLGSTVSPCPASWEGFDLDQAGTNLINGWTHGTVADNGLAIGASGSDSYGWKKFASFSTTTGNPFLAITYTTDGASYRLASKTPVAQVTPTAAGSFAVKVTNTGASTWTTSNTYQMGSVAYYTQGAQGAQGAQVAGSLTYTAMPSTVAPGQSATVDVKVAALGPGYYRIVMGMYHGTQSFASQGVQDYEIGLYVPEPPPVVTAVYPPTGYTSTTLQAQLSTSATYTGTVSYNFTMTCEPQAGQTCTASTVTSGSIPRPYWTPPAADLDWDIGYQWKIAVTSTSNGQSATTTVGPVTIEAEPPQPAITSTLGGSSGQAYDPLSGNYTTSATDAAVKSAGPALQIDRTYNSMDPRTSGAFGAGWSSVADTSLENDTSTVLVTLPDGQEMRFGENGDGTYAPPFGNPDALVKASSGTWTLRDPAGDKYAFSASGQFTSITDVNGYAQDFGYNSSGRLTTITDAVSGRFLTLAWSGTHVASVTTQAPAAGGAGYTWTYAYNGNELTQACAPASVGSGCTAYTYGSGSDYQASVLDADPRTYWQLGEAAGAANGVDEVEANLGADHIDYHSVTLGVTGPLAGSSESAASFNGTSSWVQLPNNLLSDDTDVSVGLWFKAASGAHGVLFGYAAGTLSSANAGSHDPALYIGTNGDLYGEFWTGSTAPVATSSAVTDSKWHYAVLSASSNSQTLYLDGAKVGTLSGQVNQLNMGQDTIGAGYWGGNWPGGGGTSATNTAIGYFGGDIGQVAVYPQPLSATAVASQYALATAASPELTQVTLPSGNIDEQASYDSATDRVATYTDPNGGQWTIGQPLASGTKTSSDALGAVTDNVQVTDPAGRQETYGYDITDGGRLISYGNGAGPPEVYGYDAAGFQTTVVDRDGHLTCLTSDVHGNVLTRSWYPAEPASLPSPGTGANPAACGGSTASSPSCAATTAPCTTFYSYYYNAANRLDPENDELLAVRDGRSASASDTTYETQYAYNTTGQLTSSTTPATSDFPSGRVTRYAYTTGTEAAADTGTEPAGLLSSQTTPGGAKTSYSYDSNGGLARVTEPSGRYTTYTYDALGRPQTSTVYTSTFSSGETTSYTYTPTGEKSTVTYPAVRNSITNVTHQRVDTYTYDADNDLLSVVQTDATGNDPARTTSYTYNDHDEVARSTQPAGATSGGSAQTGGAASANPAGATTGYAYDGFGNVTQVTDPNGNQRRYQYNEYNEPVQETLYTSSTNASNSTATCAAPATADPDGGCDLVLQAGTYDPAGLLAATTDAMGRITNYSYDHNQELIESATTQACSSSAPCTSLGSCTPTAQCTTGSVGTMTVYTYDGAGNQVSKAVSATSGGLAGTTTTYDYNYDAAGRLASQVDDATPSAPGSQTGFLNRTTAYTYNADGKILSQTTGIGSALAVTDYTYDTAGDKMSQSVQDGSSSLQTAWTYDQNGLPLSMTTPRGNAAGATASHYTTNYTYDPSGNLVTQTGPPVAVSTFASQTPSTTRPVTTDGYDTFGDKTQVQNPDQNVTTTAYDGDGRVTSVTQPAYTPPGATSSITATAAYGYDEDGNLTSVTDPGGNLTTYTYDALGDKTSITDPQLPGQSAPGTWAYTYDAAGEQLSAKDPLGNQTQQTYDYFGNMATSTDALQNTTHYAYDYLGDQTLTITPDGSTTASAYNDLGEPTSVTDGAGNKTASSYDDRGNLAVTVNPDGTSTQYAYDQANQLTSVTDMTAAASGQAATAIRSQSLGYDADGNQTTVKDWNGITTTFAYDAAGNLTSRAQPVSSSASITTSYAYDAAGNPTGATNGNGNTTWTTYNSWNLPESVIQPTTPAAPATADTTWTTAYNKTGLPATVTEPGGVTLTYGYDPLGDTTSESGSGATAATPNQSFTYDLDGRMTAASAPGGTDTFTYYPTGNPDTAAGPSGNSSYTYNNDGLISSSTSAAGTTSYTYDNADRLATQTDPLTGSTATWKYNNDSNPSSVSYATSGTAGPAENFGYDNLQRPTSDSLTSASGSTLASETYGYDNNGNVTSQTTGGLLASSSQTYQYDQANRLKSATANGTTVSYGYDNNGNMTQNGPVTSSYNAQDQLTASTAPAGTTTYAYTPNGSLSSVTPPGGTSQNYTFDAYGNMATAPGGVSYAYDALNRMTARTTSTGTTPVSYLGASTAIASDGTSRYSYGPSGNVTAEGPASGGSADQLMTDQHGDIAAAFTPAAGTSALAGSASYGPWGNVTGATGSMPGVGYQSDYTDPVTGLVHMNARWYNPANGTFVSTDTLGGTPIPAALDGNPYAYADGNPVTNTDPTGHGEPEVMDGAAADLALWEAEMAAQIAGPEDEPLAVEAAWNDVSPSELYTNMWEPSHMNTYLQGMTSLEMSAGNWVTPASSPGPSGYPASPCNYSYCPSGTGYPASPCNYSYCPGGGQQAGYPASPCSYSYCPGGGGLIGTCGAACIPLPPPPPPPPQDIYATGAPVPAASSQLLHTQWITHVLHDTTSITRLFETGHGIIQHAKRPHNKVQGTQPSGNLANTVPSGPTTNPATAPPTPAPPTPVSGLFASSSSRDKSKIVLQAVEGKRNRGQNLAQQHRAQAPSWNGRGNGGNGGPPPTLNGCSEENPDNMPFSPVNPLGDPGNWEDAVNWGQGADSNLGPGATNTIATVGVHPAPPTASAMPAPGIVDPAVHVLLAAGMLSSVLKQWIRNRNKGGGCP